MSIWFNESSSGVKTCFCDIFPTIPGVLNFTQSFWTVNDLETCDLRLNSSRPITTRDEGVKHGSFTLYTTNSKRVICTKFNNSTCSPEYVNYPTFVEFAMGTKSVSEITIYCSRIRNEVKSSTSEKPSIPDKSNSASVVTTVIVFGVIVAVVVLIVVAVFIFRRKHSDQYQQNQPEQFPMKSNDPDRSCVGDTSEPIYDEIQTESSNPPGYTPLAQNDPQFEIQFDSTQSNSYIDMRRDSSLTPGGLQTKDMAPKIHNDADERPERVTGFSSIIGEVPYETPNEMSESEYVSHNPASLQPPVMDNTKEKE